MIRVVLACQTCLKAGIEATVPRADVTAALVAFDHIHVRTDCPEAIIDGQDEEEPAAEQDGEATPAEGHEARPH